MTTLVRPAAPSDAAALSRLAEATFRETFIDGFGIRYPADDLARWVPEAFGATRFRGRIGDRSSGVWVAEVAGEPVGFATTGSCGLPHADVRAGDGELFQLYLLVAHQGRGLGAALFDAAADWLGRAYPGRLWLGVWSGNGKAQRFYRARGFEKVGDYRFPVGRWHDDEFIFRRD